MTRPAADASHPESLDRDVLETVAGGIFGAVGHLAGKGIQWFHYLSIPISAYASGKRQLAQGHSMPYAIAAGAVEAVNQLDWGLPAVISDQILKHPEPVYHLEK
jgi:hypothetical protein